MQKTYRNYAIMENIKILPLIHTFIFDEDKLPNEIFKRRNEMDFGEAIRLLKQGKAVSRSGWNGKDMFLFLRKGRLITGVHPESYMVKATGKTEFTSLDHICMKNAQGDCVVGWLASQTDMLAEDWVEVEL